VPLYYFFFKHKTTYRVSSPEHHMYKTASQRQCSASLKPDNIPAAAELGKEFALVLFLSACLCNPRSFWQDRLKESKYVCNHADRFQGTATSVR